jgi:hypothetical protein
MSDPTYPGGLLPCALVEFAPTVTTLGYRESVPRSRRQVACTSDAFADNRARHGGSGRAPFARMMWRAAATLMVLCGLVACGNEQSLNLDVTELDGHGTMGLSVSGQPVKGLVVYFHGRDQTPNVIKDSVKHRALFDPLLSSGYAVVSGDAGGSAFGNVKSRQEYRRLIGAARAKYGAEPKLFVAESMGALPALALLGEPDSRLVSGMVGITPLMGIPLGYRSIDFIASAWNGVVPDSGDPMSWPPDLFAGRNFRLYQADADDVIPSGATARDFAYRFGSVAKVEVIPCAGGHVADDCYDGAGVQKWLAGLG